MTREELKEHCKKQIEMCEMWATAKGEKPCGKVYEEHKLILELLEQQTCNNAISRADVEQTVEDNILCYTHSDRPIDQDPDTDCHKAIRTALRMLRKDLRKLPPVTPQPKIGRWIAYEVRLPDRTILNYRCSVCGRKLIGYNTETLSEAPFCHCGAKMGD